LNEIVLLDGGHDRSLASFATDAPPRRKRYVARGATGGARREPKPHILPLRRIATGHRRSAAYGWRGLASVTAGRSACIASRVEVSLDCGSKALMPRDPGIFPQEA